MSKQLYKHGVPTLFSLVIPGFGQLVKGHVAKGLIFILTDFLLLKLLFSSGISFAFSRFRYILLTTVENGLDADSQEVAFLCCLFSFVIFYLYNLYDAYNAN